MSRRGDWLLVGAGLVLVAAATVVLVEVFRLPPTARNDIAGLGGFTLALAGAVVSILGWLRRVGRLVGARPVSAPADSLAEGVYGQWSKAAGERVLLTPAPIPIRWSLSSLPVTGTLAAALDGPFTPLPDVAAVTEEQLRAGGGRRELFAVYAGLASGRVVVVGPPGSGKSGSAVLLVLDALEHRKRVDDTERARVPVPVLFTAHGWDPTTYSAGDWLTAQLVATYPLFQHRGGQTEAAAVVAAGAIALILDGLDEMDQALRPAALRALSDAPFRVVVLTRSQEMVGAAAAAYLTCAAALQLHDVTGPEGADYLEKACREPPPSGWSQLLNELREHPDSVLSRGLSTPLALSLVRDTYQTGDDVRELLNCGAADDLEQHLIARVLPAAYTSRSGRPKPRYSLPQATQTLTFIARQMNHDGTRDLAWWHIPRWAPTTRILTSMLATGLIGALFGGLAFGLVDLLWGFVRGIIGGGLVGVLTDMLLGLALGCGIGLSFGVWSGRGGRAPKLVKNWRAINVPLVLTTGLIYGFVSGFVLHSAFLLANNLVARLVPPSSLAFMPVSLLVWGLVVGLVGRPLARLIEGERRPHGRQKGWRAAGVLGLGLGLVGLVVGLMETHHLLTGLLMGLLFGGAGGLAGGLADGFAGRLAGKLVEGEKRPRSPRESWRDDRVFGFVFGLVIGLAVGLGLMLVGLMLFGGLGNWLLIGSNIGLTLGLVCGITSSGTWPTTLAWLHLRHSGVPAMGLMGFLEDARTRGVLRTVGAVYQFRHAALQDHLVGQTASSAATPSLRAEELL